MAVGIVVAEDMLVDVVDAAAAAAAGAAHGHIELAVHCCSVLQVVSDP